jgi:hypothetical protein
VRTVTTPGKTPAVASAPTTPNVTKTVTTTAPAPSSTAPAAPLGSVGSGHASGDFAVAQASGTVANPSRIELRVVASPPQAATVTWTMVCQEAGGGVGSKSGQTTLQLPTTESLPLPAPSNSCDVSVNSQLSGSGVLQIAISG